MVALPSSLKEYVDIWGRRQLGFPHSSAGQRQPSFLSKAHRTHPLTVWPVFIAVQAACWEPCWCKLRACLISHLRIFLLIKVPKGSRHWTERMQDPHVGSNTLKCPWAVRNFPYWIWDSMKELVRRLCARMVLGVHFLERYLDKLLLNRTSTTDQGTRSIHI